MGKLVVIRGGLGTGKTTVANILHNESTTPTVLVPKDLFAIDIIKNNKDLYLPMKEAYFAVLRRFLLSEVVVITDGAFLSDHWFSSFSKIEKEDNVESAVHFYLTVSEDKAVERSKQRPKADVVLESEVREVNSKMKPLNWENETIINTEELTAREVATKIANLIDVELKKSQEKSNWRSDSFVYNPNI